MSNNQSVPSLSKFNITLRLLLLLVMGLWFWQQWNFSKSSWEGLGDAHFYAVCADHYVQTGENKWFEIYPVALFQGSGIEMSFASFGHPQFIAFWIKWGWTSSEATLLASLVAFIAMLFSLGYWVARGLGWDRALLVMVFLLYLPKMSTYANSGGPEALSLFFLINSVACLIYFEGRLKWWLVVLAFSVLGALVRPHNQIFLLGLVFPALFWAKEQRWKLFSTWLLGVTAFKMLGYALVDHKLKFGYLFSFLVGTEIYPQHSLFRTYFSDGFKPSFLLELKDQIVSKVSIGVQLLKMYWPGWLPQSILMVVSLLFRPAKSIWILMLGLLSVIIFLAAMGHLVPRYWEMLQPVTLLFFLLCLIKRFNWDQRSKPPASLPLLLGIVLLIYSICSMWPYVEKRDVYYTNIPVQLMEKIKQESWVACSKPSKIIDLWKKPILLLPESVEMVDQIDVEVKNLNALILTPNYQSSEYALWMKQNEVNLRLNWKVYNFDDWTVLIRRNLEKSVLN